MTKLLSFLFSVGLLLGLIASLWLVDTLRERPDIPSQIPAGASDQIILPKKKHNPIDDHCLPCLDRLPSPWLGPSAAKFGTNWGLNCSPHTAHCRLLHSYTSGSPAGRVFQRL